MHMSSSKTLVISILFVLFAAASALANESSVEIDVPDKAEKGSTVTIKITVRHDGNSFMHYTDRVVVKVNGEEAALWEYSWRNRPETEVFTKEVTRVADGPLDIRAQAHCNIHGSAGEAQASVGIK